MVFRVDFEHLNNRVINANRPEVDGNMVARGRKPVRIETKEPTVIQTIKPKVPRYM